MSTPSNTYLDLADTQTGGGHPINLWWTASQPDRIHLVLTDPRLLDGNGEKPGLRLVLSANPKSADYSPANFNRCARLLRSLEMPAPEHDVPEHPRHLRYRDHVIDTVVTDSHGVAGGPVPPGATVPGPMPDAEVCDICWCYVANVKKHQTATHTQ
ncbi:MAG TPA: hypothetical protein VFX41_12055 [Actinomycetales bacterium]|jgi:hypothetical protein|nr:hypothetical protein [Actinomycetales bacterium]